MRVSKWVGAGLLLLAVSTPAEELTVGLIKDFAKQATTLQWEEGVRKIQGSSVVWEGWVKDVKAGSDGYEAWIDMDPPATVLSVPEVIVPVSRQIATRLEKNQHVRIHGSIARIARPLGMVMVYLQPGATIDR